MTGYTNHPAHNKSAPDAQRVERALMDAADLIGATLAQPADERAWWHLLTYCPPELLSDFIQARVYRRIEEIRKGDRA